jgi:hypothetical protein
MSGGVRGRGLITPIYSIIPREIFPNAERLEVRYIHCVLQYVKVDVSKAQN